MSMSYAVHVKNKLMDIIHEMASHASDFATSPVFFSRNRKLGFEPIINMMISMEAGAVRDELLKYFDYSLDTPTNSSFYQQRAKISPDAFPHILHEFNDGYSYALYKNRYQILAVDGSSFTYTRNPDDPDSYFPPNEKTTNGYNQIHVIPTYDLLSKRYVDCVVQPIRKKNEFQAMCQLIDQHQPSPGSKPIFIADRGFHSYNVFAHAIENDYYFIVRATDLKMKRLLGCDLPSSESFDIRVNRILTRSASKKKRLNPDKGNEYRYICKNVTFDYIDPETNPEYNISLRVLRFKISDDGYENIITNLPEGSFSANEMKLLYHLRWGIETSFRELKHVIGALNFHSKDRKYIEMEVWARLLLYNFCTIITSHVVINKKEKKYFYQVNFSNAMKVCHYFLRLKASVDPPDVEGLIGKSILPVRPDRTYARNHRFRVPASFTYRFA